MTARRLFRGLGSVVAIAGLIGVGLCGLLLLLDVSVGVEAAMLSRALTGSAALAGAGAFAFLNASGLEGGDPDSFGGGSAFDADGGDGDSGDTGGDSGGDGGGK